MLEGKQYKSGDKSAEEGIREAAVMLGKQVQYYYTIQYYCLWRGTILQTATLQKQVWLQRYTFQCEGCIANAGPRTAEMPPAHRFEQPVP